MTYPENITPTCRYGHGPLQEEVLDSTSKGLKRYLAIPSFIWEPNTKGIEPDNGGFTVKPYRCARCGYMEFFDKEA